MKLLDERNFEAVRLAWGGGGVEIDLKQVWHSASSQGAGSNFINYSNPQVDKLIDQARTNYDRDKRIALLKKAYELIADDYPYIWFFNSRYTLYAHSLRIEKPKDTFVYGVGQQYWTIK